MTSTQSAQPSSQTEYRGISRRCKDLLKRREGFDVEFKATLSAIKPENLVAYANSVDGGAILVGVAEVTDGGVQRGRVVGCAVDDDAILQVVNKAEGCYPPVVIEVVIENLSNTPFLRVEIQPGAEKPYCTGGGRYLVRHHNRNAPMLPSRLMKLMMEQESAEFLERFRGATADLEKQVEVLGDQIGVSLERVHRTVDQMHRQIEYTLTDVGDQTQESMSHAEQGMMFAEEASIAGNESIGRLEGIGEWLGIVDRQLRVLLDHLNLEDPRLTDRREIVRLAIEREYSRTKRPTKSRIREAVKKDTGGFYGIWSDQLFEEEWERLKVERRKARIESD